MYMEGSRQYKYHVQTYGHPSNLGFKDLIATWKADKFDPDYLMQLYQKSRREVLCGMAVHHDNFDLWNSKYQPRWNAVASAPKKDILGMIRKAALKQGLKFAVSEHLSNSYNWFSTSHGSDKSGPNAGVPYDGIAKCCFREPSPECPGILLQLPRERACRKRAWYPGLREMQTGPNREARTPVCLWGTMAMEPGRVPAPIIRNLAILPRAPSGSTSALPSGRASRRPLTESRTR
jgi:hypothetical protein